MILKDNLIKIINEKSFIYLDEFLRMVHQDKNLGYYTTQNPIGSQGDFITAPEVSQLFGEIIALTLINKINQKKIKKFQLVELGPGRGTLMKDIERIFNKSLSRDINYSINFIEINKNYKSKLMTDLPNSCLHSSLKTLKKEYSVIIANEFFDCLPMCQIKCINKKLYETTIKLDKKLNLVFDKTLARKKIVEEIDIKLDEGDLYEFSLETNDIFNKISKIVRDNGGLMLIADYGHKKPTFRNSLQSLKNNKFTEVLDNIGTQDITYHVNFNNLALIAKQFGLKNVNIRTQANFLKTNGINIRAEQLVKSNPKSKDKIINQLSRLVDPENMGNLFKILEAEY
tara:strand:+ start:386 stop:1411 length:1026 start_codon:yes stop_codon:yes gene_type:complete